MEELRGRNALVTGAGGGLGAYIARALAGEGVNLALTDLPGAPVDGLAAELRTRGVQVEHAPADLTDRDERRRLATWAEDALGPMDILVNNAGVEFGGAFLRHDARGARGDRRGQPARGDGSDAAGSCPACSSGVAVTWSTSPRWPARCPRPTWPPTRRPSTAWSGSRARCAPSSADEPVGFSAICPASSGRVGMFGRLEPTSRAGSVPIGHAFRRSGSVRRSCGRSARTSAEIVLAAAPVKPLILLNAVCAARWPPARRQPPDARVRGAIREGPRALQRRAARGRLPRGDGRPSDRLPRRRLYLLQSVEPEKGGGPNLTHMFLGTLEVQGR